MKNLIILSVLLILALTTCENKKRVTIISDDNSKNKVNSNFDITGSWRIDSILKSGEENSYSKMKNDIYIEFYKNKSWQEGPVFYGTDDFF